MGEQIDNDSNLIKAVETTANKGYIDIIDEIARIDFDYRMKLFRIL